MKTIKNLITIVATVFVFSNISYAANTKSQSPEKNPRAEMMDSDMTEMQKEMDQIKNTKDPKAKQVLLKKHMQNMQTHMTKMGKKMKNMGMMEGKMGKGKMMGQNNQGMMDQMGQMHSMMGQMMSQMQDHMNSCSMNQASKKK